MRRLSGTRHDVRSSPALDPTAGFGFWCKLYTDHKASAALIRALPPPTPDGLLVASKRDVIAGLHQARDSSAGPDGLPPLVLKLYSNLLADTLAPAISLALQRGLPPELCLGELCLVPKPPLPSRDPSAYRPIALLPAIIRLVLKILDTKIREYANFPSGARWIPPKSKHLLANLSPAFGLG